MATNVSIASILDATVAQLSAQLVPSPLGSPVTSQKPVFTCQRYMGGEFRTEEGLTRGIAGRCPALRVRFAGSKSVKTTIGRRVDRVESAIQVIVASDSHRSKDDRKKLLAIAESVRRFVGSH